MNKININISKTEEIVFKRPSLIHYNSSSPIVQIEQVSQAKLLGVFLTPTNAMLTHVNDIAGIMSQRLYLLNQLRKQGINSKCITELFVRQVIARFQYALSAFAGQFTVSDIN